MIDDITKWLASDRNIKKGMELFLRVSQDTQKRKILINQPINRKRLLPIFFKALLPQENTVNNSPPIPAEKPKSTSQIFSKEFKNVDFAELPDTLQLLVIRRIKLHKQAQTSYQAQHNATNKESRLAAAQATIEAIKENWAIWDELNHFALNKKVLGKHSSFNISSFNAFVLDCNKLSLQERNKEFLKYRNRCASNIRYFARKKKLSEKQLEIKNLWIYKHNEISNLINESLWNDTN